MVQLLQVFWFVNLVLFCSELDDKNLCLDIVKMLRNHLKSNSAFISFSSSASAAPEDLQKSREASQRMNDLLRRSQTVQRVKDQAQDLSSLRSDLNRWRNKMFPALPMGPKH